MDIEYRKEINSALRISVSSHLTSQSDKNELVRTLCLEFDIYFSFIAMVM